jgi:hypothetical protein
VDAVEYDDFSPWPEAADGNGPTLELINPSLDNALAESWSASTGNGSPGAINTSYLTNDDEDFILPTEFIVHNNFPNPFNPTTTISYELPKNSFVNIIIYDVLGREVKVLVSGELVSGFHEIIWNGTNKLGHSVSAGVYFYTVSAGDKVQTGKMILLK